MQIANVKWRRCGCEVAISCKGRMAVSHGPTSPRTKQATANKARNLDTRSIKMFHAWIRAPAVCLLYPAVTADWHQFPAFPGKCCHIMTQHDSTSPGISMYSRMCVPYCITRNLNQQRKNNDICQMHLDANAVEVWRWGLDSGHACKCCLMNPTLRSRNHGKHAIHSLQGPGVYTLALGPATEGCRAAKMLCVK